MNFLVLGCGLMGKSVVNDLLSNPDVSSVVVGDIDVDSARRYVNGMKEGRVSAEFVDVRDHESLVERMKAFDVVVNSTWYEFNLAVTQAAIEAKICYTDLGGLYHKTLEQLKLNDSAKAAQITAVIGCGASPGLTNILARYGADRMDSVEEIRVRVCERPRNTDRFTFGYSIRTILAELLLKPIVFQEGKFIEIEPMSGLETVRLPDPLGEFNMIYTLHSELATLPKSINKGVKKVDFKIGYSSALVSKLKTLIDLGLTNTKPLKVRGTEIQPLEFIIAHLDSLPKEILEYEGMIWIELYGEENGARVQRIYSTTSIDRTTGITASIISQMLARGEIKVHGVHPPENCVNPKTFIAEMATRNIAFKESISKDCNI